MTIYVVMSVCRQISGESVALRAEKAFKQANKAEEFLQELKKSFVDINGKPKSIVLNTEQGAVTGISSAGIFQLELED